jgi:hypothetical protein
LDDNFAPGGQGSESFEVEMNNLTPGTTYYVRAYATNGFGTGYSSIEISFTTSSFNIAGDWLCTIYNNDGSPYAENVLVTLNEDGTANCFDYSTTSGQYLINSEGTITISLPYSVAGLIGTVELNGEIDDLNNPMRITGVYNLDSNGIHIDGPLQFEMERNTKKR